MRWFFKPKSLVRLLKQYALPVMLPTVLVIVNLYFLMPTQTYAAVCGKDENGRFKSRSAYVQDVQEIDIGNGYTEFVLTPTNRPCVDNPTARTCRSFIASCGPDGMGNGFGDALDGETTSRAGDRESDPRTLNSDGTPLDQDGNPIDGDGSDGTPDTNNSTDLVNGDSDAAKTVSEIQNSISRICFVCPIAAHIFTASMTYPPDVMEAGGEAMARFLSVILAIWLLWHVTKILLPFGVSGGMASVGNNIFLRIILVIAVVTTFSAAGFSNIYWEYVYRPVMSGAIEFGHDIITEGSPKDSFLYRARYQDSDPDAGDRGCYSTDMRAIPGFEDTATGETSERHKMKDKLECQIHTLQRAFSYGLAVGIYTFSSPEFGAITAKVSGGLLIAMFILPIMLFSVMVIDALIKWTVVSVITPVLAGCACFPSTRKYAVIGYKTVLESGLNLIIAAIVAVLLANMVNYAVIRLTQDEGAFAQQAVAFDDATQAHLIDAEAITAEEIEENIDDVDDATASEPVVQLNLPDYTDQFASGLNRYQQHQTMRYVDALLTDTPTGDGGLDKPKAGPPGPPSSSGPAMGGNWGFPILNPQASCNAKETIGPGSLFCNQGGVCPRGRSHSGLDIACDRDTPLLAMAGGVVNELKEYNGACGHVIGVNHNAAPGVSGAVPGYETRYCHMNKFVPGLKLGDVVQRGQVIGYVGTTGGSTGDHLHIEIYQNGVPIDPYPIVFEQASPATGMVGASDRQPPLTLANGDWWLLFATGLISKHAMMNIAPMTSTILSSPALGGIGMAVFASMAGLVGAGMREAKGAAGTLAGPGMRSAVQGGVNGALAPFLNSNGIVGDMAREISLNMQRQLGDAPVYGTATAPRTGEASVGHGPRYEQEMDFVNDLILDGTHISAADARAMAENPEEAEALLEGLTEALASMGMGTAAALSGGNINAVNAGNDVDAAEEADLETGEINEELLDGVIDAPGKREIQQGDKAVDEMTEENIDIQAEQQEQKELDDITDDENKSALQERVEDQIADAKIAIDDVLDNVKDLGWNDVGNFALTVGLVPAVMLGNFAADKVNGGVNYTKTLGRALKAAPRRALVGAPSAIIFGGLGLAGAGAKGLAGAAAEQVLGTSAFMDELNGKSVVGAAAAKGVMDMGANYMRRQAKPTATTTQEKVDRLTQLAKDEALLREQLARIQSDRELLENSNLDKANKKEILENMKISEVQLQSAITLTVIAGSTDVTGCYDHLKKRINVALNKDYDSIKKSGNLEDYQKEIHKEIRAYSHEIGMHSFNPGAAKTERLDSTLLGMVAVANSFSADRKNNIVATTMDTARDLRSNRQELQKTLGLNTNIDKTAAFANHRVKDVKDVVKAMGTKQEWEKTTEKTSDIFVAQKQAEKAQEAQNRELSEQSMLEAQLERKRKAEMPSDPGKLTSDRQSIFDEMREKSQHTAVKFNRPNTDILKDISTKGVNDIVNFKRLQASDNAPKSSKETVTTSV